MLMFSYFPTGNHQSNEPQKKLVVITCCFLQEGLLCLWTENYQTIVKQPTISWVILVSREPLETVRTTLNTFMLGCHGSAMTTKKSLTRTGTSKIPPLHWHSPELFFTLSRTIKPFQSSGQKLRYDRIARSTFFNNYFHHINTSTLVRTMNISGRFARNKVLFQSGPAPNQK